MHGFHPIRQDPGIAAAAEAAARDRQDLKALRHDGADIALGYSRVSDRRGPAAGELYSYGTGMELAALHLQCVAVIKAQDRCKNDVCDALP